ncbi:hypothetical protein I3842_03G018600 [Carya illinoinensis]|uniref:SEC7 domain-containing protein n=1 Tax=Carya illinoinensis TaxID=32201 RepID=A0A922JT50_CARIL|nr:hypothetical protein I3842_03G018600 [Carya illinoinensis]
MEYVRRPDWLPVGGGNTEHGGYAKGIRPKEEEGTREGRGGEGNQGIGGRGVSIVLNLYHHLRTELKVQLEAFLSCVLLRLAQSKHGSSYQQQEVAMEAMVDLANLLSKSAFLVNGPLFAMHILALDGNEPPSLKASLDNEVYEAFWTMTCENYSDPNFWVPYVCKLKFFKRNLMVGADHFNRDPKKGLEFLQGMHLLPDKLDPKSVACFLRYTTGLDKNLVGDFLGNHDEFCVQVLPEFAWTFDFQYMNLDTALRLFLGTFRLPGESQKMQRSPHILINKDAALVLSYSLIMLNTDQHNAQVKKKMTEEDFIRNNRKINGGKDLPCEFLELLTYDMFTILSGLTIAAMLVIFYQVEREDVLQTCIDGFLFVAKIAACYHLDVVLDDLVVSLCKFTTLLTPLSIEEAIVSFGDNSKARMATTTVFTIANRYGDYIHSGCKNILDCVLSLYNLGLLPASMASDAEYETEPPSDLDRAKPATTLSASHMLSLAPSRKSSGLMGRFSQLLSFDMEEPRSQPTEKQLVAQQHTRETIQKCHIDSIFTESKFLQAESLLQLVKALILDVGRLYKVTGSIEDEDTAVFSLELLITITLNNRDKIMLLWQGVYEHIFDIVQSTILSCPLVEKVVFGLLKICQRLLPYKENLTDELLKSLQLVLKLNARVADAYCEHIMQEVMRLVKANATHIRSHLGWRTIISLLSITARHPEAFEVGFEVGEIDQYVSALDLMPGSVLCLASMKVNEDTGEMWLRLRSLTVVDGIHLPNTLWLQCFDQVIFVLLDDLLEIVLGKSPKDYRHMEGTLVLAMKLMSKVFLHLVLDLGRLPSFCKLWLGVLNRMEKYMNMKFRGRCSEKIHELIPELLKNTLLVMKTTRLLTPSDAIC